MKVIVVVWIDGDWDIVVKVIKKVIEGDFYYCWMFDRCDCLF